MCSSRSKVILHLITQFSPLHPAHGEQVHRRPEEAMADAVFRISMAAWTMPDGNLLHPEPLHPEESRQEAVHSVVQHQTPHGLRPKRLERAAGVGDRLVAQAVAHVVGDL